MFGYGSMIASTNTGKAAITKTYLGVDNLSDGVNPLVYASSQIVNALPFLTYQKIYYDFYSNPQWEKHLAYAYNVDYWSGSSQLSLVTDMVKLRYANYPKDYFMGMLPNSQYGSVATLPALYGSGSYAPNDLVAFNDKGNSGVFNLPASKTSPVTGAEWIKRYNRDVYPRDVVIARGHESKPPRYYDKFLQRCDVDKLEEVKFSRYTRSQLNVEDSSPERLAVREEVTKARISSLSRKL